MQVNFNRNLNPSERWSALKQVARGLAAEFPAEPGGYESLLGMARSSRDPAEARALAEEVAGMAAPEEVRQQARQLVERFALVGQKIAPILDDAGFHGVYEADRALIIYAWNMGSEHSRALAEKVGQQSGDAKLVGLCLDADLIAARDLAEKTGLPGRQFYDGRARSGALAQALRLTEAGWIYLVDRTGTVLSVRGQDDPQVWQTL